MAMDKLITPRAEDASRWYTDVVTHGKLADYSPVKGCMVIRPNGYTLWENMQAVLDRMFKDTGHENAYFPLFIPKSFLAKEAEHVEGFAKECAIVTHTRLKTAEVDGKPTVVPDPESKLEEELIVRPTSETIIYSMFAKWAQSYRDLPILMNQWANVVRWEMRTRMFLRTTEFLWQEGHTAHATEDEAMVEARKMLDVYADFAENYLAVPVIKGTKTASERFAGAVETFCIEAMMQDCKALQAGTSHFLGQNFSKAFDVKYQTPHDTWEHVWNTSWGMSTRMIGAVIMTHGDDNGVIMPPRVAPTQVVVVPIWRKNDPVDEILSAADKVAADLKAAGLRVKIDKRDNLSPGFKVPLRVELGPKDLAKGTVVAAQRNRRNKTFIPMADLTTEIPKLLETVQQEMFDAAVEHRAAHTFKVDSYDEFKEKLDEPGGFLLAHWGGDDASEARIKEETGATIRCIPFDGEDEPETKCIRGEGTSTRRVIFARSY